MFNSCGGYECVHVPGFQCEETLPTPRRAAWMASALQWQKGSGAQGDVREGEGKCSLA